MANNVVKFNSIINGHEVKFDIDMNEVSFTTYKGKRHRPTDTEMGRNSFTDQDFVADMVRVHRKLGIKKGDNRRVTIAEYIEHSLFTPQATIGRMGSVPKFSMAVRDSGVTQTRVSNKLLMKHVRELNKRAKGELTRKFIREHGKVSDSTLTDRFGNLTNAIEVSLAHGVK